MFPDSLGKLHLRLTKAIYCQYFKNMFQFRLDKIHLTLTKDTQINLYMYICGVSDGSSTKKTVYRSVIYHFLLIIISFSLNFELKVISKSIPLCIVVCWYFCKRIFLFNFMLKINITYSANNF